MPDELDIEKSSRTAHALKLHIAKINPLISEVGTSEDKMELTEFSNRMIKVFGKSAIRDLPNNLLKNEEVISLKMHYKDEFDEVVDLGKQAFSNLEKYGFTNWYNWRIDNWGTKWNACNTMLSYDGLSIYFDTAWTPSVPVIEQFAKMYPELKITHDYAEEQIAYFCGKHEYENGECISREDYEEYSKEAFEMYFDLWGCEDEFVFDPVKNTYVSKENVEVEAV